MGEEILPFLFGFVTNFSYICYNIKQNKMKERLQLVINVTFITCVIGLALSYVTQIVPNFPKLNFLEAVGVYCIWTPIHNLLMRRDDE